jgi:hypothetical protein
MSITNFGQARDYLLQYPPKWALYIPQQYASYDRIDEPGGSSNPSERKNYAFPYRELSYYDVVVDGRDWLDRMGRRYTRRGLRPPSHQVWLHYILPSYRTTVTGGNCQSAGVNNGTGRPFNGGNLFVLFSTAADLWNRRLDWGGNLAFVQRDNANALAFMCWISTWSERKYLVRWLDRPDTFWDAILEALCQRSGIDAPCCTENLRGFYIDDWIDWHKLVTGGTPAGEYHTPVAASSLYTNAQAIEAWRQFYVQAKRILREHDAFKSERPANYAPEICSNTYSAQGLDTSLSASAYSNPYVIPPDGYITQTVYVNRNSWAWDWYTNPNRRTDSIMVEEWYWHPYRTQLITGNIYRSAATGAWNRDARILTALRHGATVYLQVPQALSRDDYEAKVLQIAKFWSTYRNEFQGRIFFVERNHREVPRVNENDPETRIPFVPYNGNPLDRRAGYPQPVSRLLRWNYDQNPEFRPIKLTLDPGEAQ